MKYKVGDKVRIRRDLSTGDSCVNEKMLPFAGELATITRVYYSRDVCEIDIDHGLWVWHESMLEDVDEEIDAIDEKSMLVDDVIYWLHSVRHDYLSAKNKHDLTREKKAEALKECVHWLETLKEQIEKYKKDKAKETDATDKTIRPDYYKFHGYDVFDIADYFGLSFPLGNALKYLLRAGKKDSATWEQDLSKCKKCIERAMEMRRSE